MKEYYDFRYITTFALTNNTDGLWWHQKCFTTSTSLLTHLLQMQAMHHQFQRYLPFHNFLSGVDNSILDRPSHSCDHTDTYILDYMDKTKPQSLPLRQWTMPNAILSDIASTLWRTTLSMAYLLAEPLILVGAGLSGSHSAGTFILYL